MRKIPAYFWFCFIGCASTCYIASSGCNAVTSSSIVGIIISVFAITIEDSSRVSWAGFAGSFAGMSSPNFISGANSDGWIFLAGTAALSLTVALLYSLSEIISLKYRRNFLDGYGGRLGIIAFISAVTYIFLSPVSADNLLAHAFSPANHFRNPPFFLCIPAAVSAAFISMKIKNAVSTLNDNYKVLSVAITGIIGGVLVAKVPRIGDELSLAWYSGAFVGMSSYFVLTRKKHYLLSGLWAGIFYIASGGFFNGVGGKLGVISCAAVLTMKSFSAAKRVIKSSGNFFREKENQKEEIELDDIFAQKLAESLIKTNEGDADIFEMKKFDSGNFIVGEKYFPHGRDFAKNSVANYNLLGSRIQEMIKFITNIGIDRWLYLQEEFGYFAAISHKGVGAETIDSCKFKSDSRFIDILVSEKRIISFGKAELTHNLFTSRFSAGDMLPARYLIAFPVFDNSSLQGFFLMMDDNDDIETLQINMELLKHYYDEL